MRVKCVGDASGQIIVTCCRSKPWNVKIGFIRIASKFYQSSSNKLLRARVMYERRFQLGQYRYVFFDRKLKLSCRRTVRTKSILDKLPCKLYQSVESGSGGDLKKPLLIKHLQQ